MNKGLEADSRHNGRQLPTDTDTRKEGIYVFVPVKGNPYAGGWLMNAQEALRLLARDDDLHGESYKVLLFVMSQLDFENWVLLTQTDIAKGLGMKQPAVARQFALLEKKEIILRGPKVGRSWSWRLNPEYGWKGKVKNLNAYRRQRKES